MISFAKSTCTALSCATFLWSAVPLIGVVGTVFAACIKQAAPAPLTIPDPEREAVTRELFAKMRGILECATNARESIQSPDGFITGTFKRTLGIDAAARAGRPRGEAFGVISDSPVTEMREQIARYQSDIEVLNEERMALAEKEIIQGEVATESDLASEIRKVEDQIAQKQARVREVRERFHSSMRVSGVELSETDTDLLLESVTGGALVALAVAHDAAKRVSEQLRAQGKNHGATWRWPTTRCEQSTPATSSRCSSTTP